MVLIEKHFTSTAFVLHPIEDKVLLHWHSKVKAWLPPGGHIENNETPVEAVKRETFEEAGIHIKLYNFNSSISEIPFSDVKEIPAPYTILLENIDDPENGEHINIDMIYFPEYKNNEVCKRVTSTKYKCTVYKDGKVVNTFNTSQ